VADKNYLQIICYQMVVSATRVVTPFVWKSRPGIYPNPTGDFISSE